jgi:hypothetical protein
MSWKEILKEMRLDADSPYQPDYDARDTLSYDSFNQKTKDEISRMREYEKDEEKFNLALSELDSLSEQFSPSEALRQVDRIDREIFGYYLNYGTREGRKQIREQGHKIMTNLIQDLLSGY